METRFADLPTAEKGVPCHAIGRFNIVSDLVEFMEEAVKEVRAELRGVKTEEPQPHHHIGYSAVCHLPQDHGGSHAGLVVWEGEWEDEDAP